MSAKDQIKQIVDFFKKEPYLKDKTDAMGDGLSLAASLADEANERSKDATETTLAVQEKYKEQILAQDLNPNKDPELVDLRNGNQTAGERIDKFEQKTIKQLAQIEADKTVVNLVDFSELLTTDNSVELTGFYNQNTFSKPIRYSIKPLTGLEVWTAISGVSLDGDLSIKIGEYKIKPIGNSINGVAYGLSDDSVLRNDHEMLQAIFDNALIGDKHINFKGSTMLINSTVYLDKVQYPRKRIVVSGGEYKNTLNTVMFSSHNTESSGGGYLFKTPSFESVKGIGTKVFDSRNIRMYFEFPEFINCDNVWYSESSELYLQTIHIHKAHVIGGEGEVFNSVNAYDIELSGLVEHRKNYMKIDTPHSVRTNDAVIEGLDGYVYTGKTGRMLSFRDVYMEANQAKNPTEPYFTFLPLPTDDYPYGVDLSGLMIQASDEQKNNPNFYLFLFDTLPKSFGLKGINTNANLFFVRKNKTIKNKDIRNMLTGSYTDKNVINGRKMTDVLEGSGALFDLRANDDLVNTQAIGSGVITSEGSGVRIRKTGGVYGGLKTTTGVPVTQGTPYVAGFDLLITTPLVKGSFVVYLDDPNGTNLSTFTINLDNTKLYERIGFISTHHVTPVTSGYLQIRLSLETDGIADIIIPNFVLQRGTIANP